MQIHDSKTSYLIYQGDSNKVECRKHYFITDMNVYTNKIANNKSEKNTSNLYDFYSDDMFKTQRFYENKPKEIVHFDFHLMNSWLESNPNKTYNLTPDGNKTKFIQSSFLNDDNEEIGTLNYYYNIESKTIELELVFNKNVNLTIDYSDDENMIRILNNKKYYTIRYHIQYPFIMQKIKQL
jgi:hypothetical protein